MDCYDELRQVIRESFARHNLFHRDFPRKPNLIAKLMGLEEVPSKYNQRSHEPAVEEIVIMRPMPPMFPAPALEVPKLNKDKHSGKFGGNKTLDRVINHSKPLLPKKEAVIQKIDDTPKVAAPKSQDVGKHAILKLGKAARESNASKSQVAAPDENIQRIASLKSSTIPKKNLRKGKDNSKPPAALVENLPINIETNIQGSFMENTASEQITEQVMNASCVSGNTESDQISKSGSCIPLDKTKTNTRYQLLSSVSFLNYVEELTLLPTDDSAEEDSLFLDCAKEILMRNSFSQKLLRKPKCNEISDGIGYLRNYSNGSCGDGIYSMLERELWWNEEVTGAWDFGWRNGYTTEAVNEVVRDIEKLVLSEFVADVVIQLMPK